MILTKARGLFIGLAQQQLDFTVGGAGSFWFGFTTSASADWSTTLLGSYPAARIADTFGTTKQATILSAGINVGTGKYEIALEDTELLADGGDNSFRYVWLTETNSFRPLVFWDYGMTVNVLDGQTCLLQLNGANNVAIDIS